MCVEVLSPTYHSPITIEWMTYGVSLGTRQYARISASNALARGGFRQERCGIARFNS